MRQRRSIRVKAELNKSGSAFEWIRRAVSGFAIVVIPPVHDTALAYLRTPAPSDGPILTFAVCAICATAVFVIFTTERTRRRHPACGADPSPPVVAPAGPTRSPMHRGGVHSVIHLTSRRPGGA